MNSKICLKCHKEKNVSQFFYYNKKQGKLMPYCKLCDSNRKKKYIDNRPITDKKLCSKCKQEKDISNFSWVKGRNNYYSSCKSCVAESRRNRRSKINATRRKHRQNPEIRIRDNLQSRFSTLKNGYRSKTLIKYIGCPYNFLLGWLEFQFYDNMNFDNYGKIWHIDHCIPCNSFDFSKEDQIKKCFHWSNLRPLKAEKNFTKNAKVKLHDILMQELKVKIYKKSLFLI
jgi:hypothetical protein